MVRKKHPPLVESMIANQGLYVLHDPHAFDRFWPVYSLNGKLYSMQLDEELNPSDFVQGTLVEGPVKFQMDRSEEDRAKLNAL